MPQAFRQVGAKLLRKFNKFHLILAQEKQSVLISHKWTYEKIAKKFPIRFFVETHEFHLQICI